MESLAVMVLVFVLIIAVVAALIAFVVLPAWGEAREPGDNIKELTMLDYISDINAVNKAGYDYDMNQDQRIDSIEDHLGIDDKEVVDPSGPNYGDVAATAFSTIMDNLEISTPSEEGGVATVSWGPFSVPTDLSEVCVGTNCFDLVGDDQGGSTAGATAGTDADADANADTAADANAQEVAGFMAWPSNKMFKY